ncbi:hypothetical protein [Bacteroides xylanisolvens]|uniref:hypothetical protein n=1 Tax=Bacteroides xylanisolvens TaxID=371601 RepID=UPI001CE42E72|nr:hypothetical protein [Bacteroides xylanisolvens]
MSQKKQPFNVLFWIRRKNDEKLSLFQVGLRFRDKDTKFPRNYTYGLNHGRQLRKVTW